MQLSFMGARSKQHLLLRNIVSRLPPPLLASSVFVRFVSPGKIHQFEKNGPKARKMAQTHQSSRREQNLRFFAFRQKNGANARAPIHKRRECLYSRLFAGLAFHLPPNLLASRGEGGDTDKLGGK